MQMEVKTYAPRRGILISLAVLERHAGYRLVEFPENGRTYALCACGMTHDLWTETDKAAAGKMWWLDHIKRIRPPSFGSDQPSMALPTVLAAADALLDALYMRESENYILDRRHNLRVAVVAMREELNPI